jgi:transposase-like protein
MIKYTKLTDYKIRKIIGCFYIDLTASQSTIITGLNRNTINRFFNIFRRAILFNSIETDKEKIEGNIELDESYFGARRVRGKRGRGAAGKTIVFGILKRDDKVCLRIVPNTSREELMPIIQGKILEGSTVYTDGWKAYNGLILNGYDHYRIFHHENEFARGKNHVNGIESFWSFAKNRLNKFNGFTNNNFILHLKECEYRFNSRSLTKKEFEKMVLKLTKKYLKDQRKTKRKGEGVESAGDEIS